VLYEVILTDLSGDGIIGTAETLAQAIAMAREKVAEGWLSAAVFRCNKCVWNASLMPAPSRLQ
jgi:hypothetical protein